MVIGLVVRRLLTTTKCKVAKLLELPESAIREGGQAPMIEKSVCLLVLAW